MNKAGRFVQSIGVVLLVTGLAAPHKVAASKRLIRAAEEAVEQGRTDATEHLQKLIEALEATRRDAAADDLIDAIADLGDADGSSPVAVKRFLRNNAPPALIGAAANTRFDWTTRGDALMALRDLDASDEHFEKAISVARNDSSAQADFLNSRADLLATWKNNRAPGSLPDASFTDPDPAKEQKALAYLRAQRVGVSTASAVRAAGDGRADLVEALLDAGVKVNAAGTGAMTPLEGVITLGCHSRKGVSDDALIQTMDLLHSRGADLTRTDSRGNTILMRGAQSCTAAIVSHLLKLGAAPDPVNAQNFTPLAMAIVSTKFDVADVLIAAGAGLTKEKVDQLFLEPPTDPKIQALLERALANKEG